LYAVLDNVFARRAGIHRPGHSRLIDVTKGQSGVLSGDVIIGLHGNNRSDGEIPRELAVKDIELYFDLLMLS
jgi:hypothetical protein